MKTCFRDKVEHIFNPLHVYCRLKECGISGKKALKCARIYEVCLFKPALFCIPAIKHQKQGE